MLGYLLLAVQVLLITEILAMVTRTNNEVMSSAVVGEFQTRSPDDGPAHINVRLTAFGDTLDLKLIPREDVVFTRDFQGFVSDVDESGMNIIKRVVTSRMVHEDINSKLYTDSTGSASLYVERRNGHITLEGILDHETRIDNDNSRQGRSLDEPAKHVVYKRVTSSQGSTCLALLPNLTSQEGKNVTCPICDNCPNRKQSLLAYEKFGEAHLLVVPILAAAGTKL